MSVRRHGRLNYACGHGVGGSDVQPLPQPPPKLLAFIISLRLGSAALPHAKIDWAALSRGELLAIFIGLGAPSAIGVACGAFQLRRRRQCTTPRQWMFVAATTAFFALCFILLGFIATGGIIIAWVVVGGGWLSFLQWCDHVDGQDTQTSGADVSAGTNTGNDARTPRPWNLASGAGAPSAYHIKESPLSALAAQQTPSAVPVSIPVWGGGHAA